MKAHHMLLGSLLLSIHGITLSTQFNSSLLEKFQEILKFAKNFVSSAHLLQSRPAPAPAPSSAAHQNNSHVAPPSPNFTQAPAVPVMPKFNNEEFERFMTDEIRRINNETFCDSWWSNDSVICAHVKDTKNSFADLLWKSKKRNAEIIDDIKSIMKTYIVLYKSHPIVQNRWKKAYDRIFN